MAFPSSTLPMSIRCRRAIETAGRTEEIVGRWLKGQRDRFVLATKCRMKVGQRSQR